MDAAEPVEPTEPAAPEDPSGRSPPSRGTLVLLVVPIVALVVASNVGDALTTTWAEDHPLALLALNARNRILVLTTNQLDPVSYYLVGTLRLLLSDPLFYVLGVLYGDSAVAWLERKSPSFGEQVRIYERLFRKASYPLVFLMPNNIICLFAGASGMPVAAFAVLNVVGTVARLYLLREVGETFENPIGSVLDFFAEYRWPLLALSVLVVVATLWGDKRRGRSEVGGLLDLDKDGDDASRRRPDRDGGE